MLWHINDQHVINDHKMTTIWTARPSDVLLEMWNQVGIQLNMCRSQVRCLNNKKVNK